MADKKSTASNKALTPVLGWASGNWTQDAAVVVNPDATPLELLSWGIGQLEQTLTLMRVIGGSKDGGVSVSAAEMAGAFRHPTEQALTVLSAAAEKIFKAAKHA